MELYTQKFVNSSWQVASGQSIARIVDCVLQINTRVGCGMNLDSWMNNVHSSMQIFVVRKFIQTELPKLGFRESEWGIWNNLKLSISYAMVCFILKWNNRAMYIWYRKQLGQYVLKWCSVIFAFQARMVPRNCDTPVVWCFPPFFPLSKRTSESKPRQSVGWRSPIKFMTWTLSRIKIVRLLSALLVWWWSVPRTTPKMSLTTKWDKPLIPYLRTHWKSLCEPKISFMLLREGK